MRIAHAVAFLLLGAPLGANPPPLIVEEQPNPAAPGAGWPVLAQGKNGGLWMAWSEAGAIKCAQWGAPPSDTLNRPEGTAGDGWGQAWTIAENSDVIRSAAGTGAPDPVAAISLAVGESGHLAAAWLTPDGIQVFSLSTDRGANWLPPRAIARPAASGADRGPNSGASLCFLANGFSLAVWLAPAKWGGPPDAPCRLLTRFLGGPLAAAPDWQLAADADPRCPPKIIPLLDGGALVAYGSMPPSGARALAYEPAANVNRRDTDGRHGRANAPSAYVPRLLRLHGRRWRTLPPVAPDALQTGVRAESSIAIAADGGRVAAIWTTASGGILASLSPDAGGRFVMPATMAAASAAAPSLALVHDSAVLAVWREGTRIHLRRLSPELSADDETPLDDAANHAALGSAPQIALIRNYLLGADGAEALIAFATRTDGIHTVRVIVPESDLLTSAADACHCAPTGQQLVGYPLRGMVQSIDAGAGLVRLAIDAIPGVFDAGSYAFHADPAFLAKIQPGVSCLARIDRTPDGRNWEIIDLHLLDSPR